MSVEINPALTIYVLFCKCRENHKPIDVLCTVYGPWLVALSASMEEKLGITEV